MTDLPPVPALALPAPVLVVEDEPLVRARLERLLQLGYPADALLFAGSLAEARGRLPTPVALALVDLGLPDGNGIELIAELRAADPALGILVISAWSTEDAIWRRCAPATGYLLKERDDLEVLISLRSVRAAAPIDPSSPAASSRSCAPRPRSPSPPPGETLSPREDQILRLVAEGWATGNRRPAASVPLHRRMPHQAHLPQAGGVLAPGHPRGALARPAGLTQPTPVARRAGQRWPQCSACWRCCSCAAARGRRRPMPPATAPRADPGRPHRPGPAGWRAARRRPGLAAGHAARRLERAGPAIPARPGTGSTGAVTARAAPAALALESVIMAGEVYANDDLLWRDASQSERCRAAGTCRATGACPNPRCATASTPSGCAWPASPANIRGWGRCTWASPRPSNGHEQRVAQPHAVPCQPDHLGGAGPVLLQPVDPASSTIQPWLVCADRVVLGAVRGQHRGHQPWPFATTLAAAPTPWR